LSTVWGEEELLAVIGDPTHPEHAERLEWLGDQIDPAAFDLAANDAAVSEVG